jgi:hypothetical protein
MTLRKKPNNTITPQTDIRTSSLNKKRITKSTDDITTTLTKANKNKEEDYKTAKTNHGTEKISENSQSSTASTLLVEEPTTSQTQTTETTPLTTIISKRTFLHFFLDILTFYIGINFSKLPYGSTHSDHFCNSNFGLAN